MTNPRGCVPSWYSWSVGLAVAVGIARRRRWPASCSAGSGRTVCSHPFGRPSPSASAAGLVTGGTPPPPLPLFRRRRRCCCRRSDRSTPPPVTWRCSSRPARARRPSFTRVTIVIVADLSRCRATGTTRCGWRRCRRTRRRPSRCTTRSSPGRQVVGDHDVAHRCRPWVADGDRVGHDLAGQHRELRVRLVDGLGDRQVGLLADALQRRVGVAAAVGGLERRDTRPSERRCRRRCCRPPRPRRLR